jgi:hypothetical protein
VPFELRPSPQNRAAGLPLTHPAKASLTPANLGRASAIDDPMQDFAEPSPASCSRNDFLPFARDRLQPRAAA